MGVGGAREEHGEDRGLENRKHTSALVAKQQLIQLPLLGEAHSLSGTPAGSSRTGPLGPAC